MATYILTREEVDRTALPVLIALAAQSGRIDDLPKYETCWSSERDSVVLRSDQVTLGVNHTVGGTPTGWCERFPASPVGSATSTHGTQCTLSSTINILPTRPSVIECLYAVSHRYTIQVLLHKFPGAFVLTPVFCFSMIRSCRLFSLRR